MPPAIHMEDAEEIDLLPGSKSPAPAARSPAPAAQILENYYSVTDEVYPAVITRNMFNNIMISSLNDHLEP